MDPAPLELVGGTIGKPVFRFDHGFDSSRPEAWAAAGVGRSTPKGPKE